MIAEISSLLGTFTAGAYGVYGILALLIAHFSKQYYDKKKFDKTMEASGFQELVDRLMAECNSLGQSLHNLRMEYDRYRELCQHENGQLREELLRAEFNIAGLERRLAQANQDIIKLKGYNSGTFDESN